MIACYFSNCFLWHFETTVERIVLYLGFDLKVSLAWYWIETATATTKQILERTTQQWSLLERVQWKVPRSQLAGNSKFSRSDYIVIKHGCFFLYFNVSSNPSVRTGKLPRASREIPILCRSRLSSLVVPELHFAKLRGEGAGDHLAQQRFGLYPFRNEDVAWFLPWNNGEFTGKDGELANNDGILQWNSGILPSKMVHYQEEIWDNKGIAWIGNGKWEHIPAKNVIAKRNWDLI